MKPIQEAKRLPVFETDLDRYTPDHALCQGAAYVLYSARDSRTHPAFVLHTDRIPRQAAVVGERFDAESTAPIDNLVVPWRDRGELDGRPFFVFVRPPGGPLCSGPRLWWDPPRLELLVRIVDSLRSARDRGVHLAHCAWETLHVGTSGEVRWLCPMLQEASAGGEGAAPVITPPEATSEEGPLRITVEPLETARMVLPDGTPPVVARADLDRLESYYFQALQQILGWLVRFNFSSASGAGTVSVEPASQQAFPGRKPEEIPWDPDLSASVELRRAMQDVLTGRLGTLDLAREVFDGFGASRVVRLRSGWGTHRGRVRDSNEDALLVLEQSTVISSRPLRTVLYAVADGMGGHEAGEVASEITLKALAIEMVGGLNLTTTEEHGREILDHDFLLQVSSRAIDQTNHTLRLYTIDAHSNSRKKPGSTLVFGLCVGPVVTLGHAGDSRAYKVTAEGELERLTRDHSLVQSLVDQQKITPEEAFFHPYRHQIMSNIGMPPNRLRKDLQVRFLKEGETLVLCSDGLSDMLQDREIERMCHEHGTTDPRRLARALIDAACDRGGHDNVTVIVVTRPPSPIQDQRELAAKDPDKAKGEPT